MVENTHGWSKWISKLAERAGQARTGQIGGMRKRLVAAVAAVTTVLGGAAVILDQCPTLALGYHGGCVGELQMELNEGIGANLAVDDDFGPLTQDAVVAYQESMGLTADGIVGPQTKGALDVSNSVATPAPGAPLGPGDPGSATDGGKSLSACLGELGFNLGLEDFARKQAAARGYQLADLGGPWAVGAEMAGCILFGI
jgi:peptidoglycan hydrolase-like protein with peptidoglycan-binding domain